MQCQITPWTVMSLSCGRIHLRCLCFLYRRASLGTQPRRNYITRTLSGIQSWNTRYRLTGKQLQVPCHPYCGLSSTVSETVTEGLEASEQEQKLDQPKSRNNLFLFTQNDLDKVVKLFMGRNNIIRSAAAEYGVEDEEEYKYYLSHFLEKIKNQRKLKAASTHFKTVVGSIIQESRHVDELIPIFLGHIRTLNPLLGPKLELRRTSNMALPPAWFPQARALTRKLVYHAGPTNSGKTHNAIKHFMKADSAIYCAPLRMLAHEIFYRSNEEGSPCDLLTGEEEQFANKDEDCPAPRLSCTVEMAHLNKLYDVAVIDEVQMLEDVQRGGAWTRALLGLPAREIHLCGHECAIDIVRRLAQSMGETLEIHHYERLSPLVPLNKSLSGDYKNMRVGDCVIAFSRSAVFKIRKKIEKATKQRCAVIYGGLPPAVRVKQAEEFNSSKSKCNILVATDAVGMGLNLNIRRVVFHTLTKFDGRDGRTLLTCGHAKQIAGRAGRYGKDHPHGEVTAFHEDDLPVLLELLEKPVENVKQAGLSPSLEQIEVFSSHLPNAKFHEILSLFYKMAKLDGNYFLCDFVNKIELASGLQKTNLLLRDMYTFIRSPVEVRKGTVVKALIQFAHAHSNFNQVSFRDLCRIMRPQKARPLERRLMQGALAQLEERHEIIELYLWLSMRYPETFVDGDKVRVLQGKVEGMINKYLIRTPKSERQKSSEKKLSDNEIYAMADHLIGASPHLFRRMEELARSDEQSDLSPRERKQFQKELRNCLKQVKANDNVGLKNTVQLKSGSQQASVHVHTRKKSHPTRKLKTLRGQERSL